MSTESPLWFTLGEGIVNEVFYPRIDCANTREFGLLVTGSGGIFADEGGDTQHDLAMLEPGVPAYRVTNTCPHGRFRLVKTIFADDRRPALLVRVRFEILEGPRDGWRLFATVTPHLVNQGAHNDGWLGAFRDTPLLYARRAQVVLALGCSRGWAARSCGYVGTPEAREQLRTHGRLVDAYDSAPDGNVELIGEIAGAADGGEFLLVLGFGEHADAAGHTVRAALLAPREETQREYLDGWNAFHDACRPPVARESEVWPLYRASIAVLRIHESKRFHGGLIASLAIPWGGHHGDQDMGGYHLVWGRDLAHAGVAYLAVGRADLARQALFYLMCTQNPEGNWTQNMWVDGTPHWTARQLDQTATFVLLASLLRRHGGVGAVDPWPSIRSAADYVARHGPVTVQDRWEENEGYTPYTLATAIAALVEAARFADHASDAERAQRWRRTADDWNNAIERWLYVTDTPLAHAAGVEGYYVRIAPPETGDARDLRHLIVPLQNYCPKEKGRFEAWRITSPDALALVRYGLRRADDPRIVNTVRVIDATLADETRAGRAWRRFNHDGYGETASGGAFLGAGIGRAWPVLTGERAHYELARGDRAAAERLMHAMAKQAWHHLLPEQIWNAPDLPECGLINGEPTGSATPLVWAHAEFVTLLRSLRDGAVFDRPADTYARYLGAKSGS